MVKRKNDKSFLLLDFKLQQIFMLDATNKTSCIRVNIVPVTHSTNLIKKTTHTNFTPLTNKMCHLYFKLISDGKSSKRKYKWRYKR
jgi:hypothetical protein